MRLAAAYTAPMIAALKTRLHQEEDLDFAAVYDLASERPHDLDAFCERIAELSR